MAGAKDARRWVAALDQALTNPPIEAEVLPLDVKRKAEGRRAAKRARMTRQRRREIL
jgi:hypothetical protein